MIVTPFARELKRLRALHGLTVRQLADRIGKSVAYVGKIETQGEIPAIELVYRLATALETDQTNLLTLARAARLSRAHDRIDGEYPAALRDHHLPEKGKEGQPMAIVISLINMKGGVGKTTLASQISHAADAVDFRVLAVDLDPQANLSQSLMGPKEYAKHLRADKPTVVQIFDGYLPTSNQSKAPRKIKVEDVILKAVGYYEKSSLDLIPSRLELSRTLKNPTGKERRLAKALAQVQDEYDLIIIDCAPTESILTEAAYFASRYVIVPIKPEFMATVGLPLLGRSLAEFELENEDHTISIAGLVFVHSSTYTSGPEGQQSITEVNNVAEEYGWHIFENQVRYSASYARSARQGAPIGKTSHARMEVIKGFQHLKDEVFQTIGLQKARP